MDWFDDYVLPGLLILLVGSMGLIMLAAAIGLWKIVLA